MTWNLWWRFGDRWRERQERILSTLDAVRPDVVGLQEVWGTREATQADELGERLGLHAVFAAPSLPPPPDPPMAPDDAGVEVGVAILSRWPLREVEERRLASGHRDEIVALGGVIDHPLAPLHVIVSCLDWDLDFAAQRATQARALAAMLTDARRDGALPVFLTGDLNAPPTTSEIEVLTDGAVDAWSAAAVPGDPGHTLSRTNPLASRAAWQIDHRIDYVLARPGRSGLPVTVERVFLVGHPQGGLPPSDHYAVVADFTV